MAFGNILIITAVISFENVQASEKANLFHELKWPQFEKRIIHEIDVEIQCISSVIIFLFHVTPFTLNDVL